MDLRIQVIEKFIRIALVSGKEKLHSDCNVSFAFSLSFRNVTIIATTAR